RIAELRQHAFNDLVAAAASAQPVESIDMLRQALAMNPAARDVRMLLVQKLLTQRNWDDARAALDPLINTEPDAADVQESLAEIDVGHNQFEQAIVRYERLARREHDPRYAR